MLEHDVQRNMFEQLMVSWHSAVAAQALTNSQITSYACGEIEPITHSLVELKLVLS